jgi:hypothetical protein
MEHNVNKNADNEEVSTTGGGSGVSTYAVQCDGLQDEQPQKVLQSQYCGTSKDQGNFKLYFDTLSGARSDLVSRLFEITKYKKLVALHLFD